MCIQSSGSFSVVSSFYNRPSSPRSSFFGIPELQPLYPQSIKVVAFFLVLIPSYNNVRNVPQEEVRVNVELTTGYSLSLGIIILQFLPVSVVLQCSQIVVLYILSIFCRLFYFCRRVSLIQPTIITRTGSAVVCGLVLFCFVSVQF